ncbi:hypothetical protein VCHENC01_2918 [Vibrio harveyi]|nr:hypothetical protein VCHENC01_2918 [Vibrio harveyi]
MSLERHGDFAPIMLTNKPDEIGISSSKLLPKDRRNSSHLCSSPQE